MELSFYGANCVRVTTKKASIVVDDNLSQLGVKSVTKPTDISLRTFNGIPLHPSEFMADIPGEYEIADVAIHGVPARAHMDEEGKQSATIFTVSAADLKVAILGHIHPDLSDDQLEQIGMVDIAIVPVGGNGYTLDGTGALQVIKKMEPKIVIPTHYSQQGIRFEVPQSSLADALKNLGMEVSETLEKFKPKPAELADTTKLIVLKH